MVIVDCLSNSMPDHPREKRWNGVADHPTDCIYVLRLESVALRKSLNDCCFAN